MKVGYGCNNHCTFCHTYDVRDVDAGTEEIDRKIDRAAKLGHTMIVISGGEPTMRRELLRWAARSAARGLDFGLVTNGRMLAYAELVDKLVKLRLRYVYLSLHGGTAKVHNSLVRADAFEQTYAAVANLAGRGLDFTVNTVVTRQNLDHLRGVVDALLPFPDVVVKFSMVQPKGGGERLFEHIIPRVSDVAARVKDAIEYGLDRSEGRQSFAHDGIPFCLLPGHEDRYDDRSFATDLSYSWYKDGPSPLPSTAPWGTWGGGMPWPLPATVDQSFPKGKALAQWLKNIGATPTLGSIDLNETYHITDAVNSPTLRWLYSTSPTSVQTLSFNTPIGTPPASQCGRAVYSNFHIAGGQSGGGTTFPAECDSAPLTPQEKVMEFLLFDLASCVQDDTMPPIPPPN